MADTAIIGVYGLSFCVLPPSPTVTGRSKLQWSCLVLTRGSL